MSFSARHKLVLITTVLWPAQVVAQTSRRADQEMPVDPAREAALLRVAGQGFEIKRTPHFMIAYNTEGDLVDKLVLRVENTYCSVYRFCERNQIDVRYPDNRLEILFFNTQSEYEGYTTGILFPSTGTFGVYHMPTNRSAFFNVLNAAEMLQLQANIVAARTSLDRLVETLKQVANSNTPLTVRFQDGRTVTMTSAQVEKEVKAARRELKKLDGKRKAYSNRINQTVIQHEIAHQVLFNAGLHNRDADNPQWLVEGLACMFESPPGQTGAGIATVNYLRLKDFRSMVAGAAQKTRPTAEDFLAAVDGGLIMSPKELIINPDIFNQRGDTGTDVYALTWALTHYLQRTQNKQLADYIRQAGARKPGSQIPPARELDLFEEHFGPIDHAFLKRFSSYILKLKYRSLGADLSE